MKIRKTNQVMACLLLSAYLTADAFVVNWDKIRHWAGKGTQKAALVVQFNDGGEEKAYIWGYRWEDPEVRPSGEDMFRAIATECDDLYLFTQYTGWMGNTVCGVGFSKGNSVAEHIEFNFETAMEDPCISFNWFSANEMLGQTSTPGWDTPELCERAIEDSKSTHILEHPIDARNYGYACYDYDHWQRYGGDSSMRWHAGWYKGYWSYWVGGADSESLSYSGLGYSSRRLADGSVDAWKYSFLDGPVGGDFDGVSGATAAWHDLDYVHFDDTGISLPGNDSAEYSRHIYRPDGSMVRDLSTAAPGMYIGGEGKETKKIMIH